MGETLADIPIADEVMNYLVKIVCATHPNNQYAPDDVNHYVRNGASPRAAQAILAGARARAILDNRLHVAKEDINACAVPAIRHRLILSFEGEAEKKNPDEIIQEIISSCGK